MNIMPQWDGVVAKIAVALPNALYQRSNARALLKVTFCWPILGDYWIIGLDPALTLLLVGEPLAWYLWIRGRIVPEYASKRDYSRPSTSASCRL